MTLNHNPVEPNKITVFYDGGCPLCSREINHYRGMSGAELIVWVDITLQRECLSQHGLTMEQAMARFHVLDSDGKWQTGAYGFITLWKQLPALRWLGRVLEFLRMLPMLDWAYTRFARRRLKHRCDESVCG